MPHGRFVHHRVCKLANVWTLILSDDRHYMYIIVSGMKSTQQLNTITISTQSKFAWYSRQLSSQYLIRQAEVFAVSAAVHFQSHDVRDGGIKKPSLRGGQDGHKHVLPSEGEDERCGAVGTQH